MKFFFSTLLLTLFLSTGAQDNFNCFTVLCGKEASMDGSVFLAHNEDDGGEQNLRFFKTKHLSRIETQEITLRRGAKYLPTGDFNSLFWIEMPGMEFSDSYHNEYGVSIVSDACPSREDHGEISDGGIGYWLRRIMALQATSAREAVRIGGKLIEKYGYVSSGRTYCIADKDEAWMLSVVKGKHWIAQRVPDDEVAIIPNYFTIQKIKLQDTLNYLGSEDIIRYARKKGWFKGPDSAFNFRLAYADPNSLTHKINVERHWAALNKLAPKEYKLHDHFPFSFQPERKIVLMDLFDILRYHYENTSIDRSHNHTLGSPHQTHRAICANSTQYGLVAQHRSKLPVSIGSVLWISLFHPCIHPFIPFYNGMKDSPVTIDMDAQSALRTHFEKSDNRNIIFAQFVKNGINIDKDYQNYYLNYLPQTLQQERNLLINQKKNEKKWLTEYKTNQSQAIDSITAFCHQQMQMSLPK
jgi:dipeptidase